MSALLGVQDGNSIGLHVISFGNIFLPFLFVVTLQMKKKYVRNMFYAYAFSIWGILIAETNRLCSHCAESLGIEFSLKELRAVSGQIIGVHKLFSRSFVRCLKGRNSTCQSWLLFSLMQALVSHLMMTSFAKKMHAYIVQLFCVGQSQSHVHGISGACKFESAGMLTVTFFIQGHSSCFGLLNFQRANRDPPSTLIVVLVIWLVDILCKHKGKKNTNM